jgi:hypothetical protein
MPEPSISSGSIVPRMKEVKQGWGKVGLLFTLVTLGIGGYIQAQIDDVLSFWQVVWLTLPLTITVAIIAYRLYAKQTVDLSVLIGVIIGTFVLSAITGLSSGPQVSDAIFNHHTAANCLETNTCGQTTEISGGWVGFIFKIIGAYFHVYGPLGVVKAVIAGVFLGWSTWVLSRPKPTPTPAAPTADDNPSTRPQTP